MIIMLWYTNIFYFSFSRSLVSKLCCYLCICQCKSDMHVCSEAYICNLGVLGVGFKGKIFHGRWIGEIPLHMHTIIDNFIELTLCGFE